MTLTEIKQRQQEALRQNAQRLAAHREGLLPAPVVVSTNEGDVFWSRVVTSTPEGPSQVHYHDGDRSTR
jgi:hypothetical protein